MARTARGNTQLASLQPPYVTTQTLSALRLEDICTEAARGSTNAELDERIRGDEP